MFQPKVSLAYLSDSVKDVKKDVDNILTKLDRIISASNETNLKMAELNSKIDILSEARERTEKDIEKLSQRSEGFLKNLTALIKPIMMFVFGAGIAMSMLVHGSDLQSAISKTESIEKPSLNY